MRVFPRKLVAAALLASCCAIPTWAQDINVNGTSTTLPINTAINEHKLHLNGAGIRYKAIFKVYAAGLYLPKNTKDADEALKMVGPKRVTLVFLRELDAKEFGSLMIKGVENNVKDRKLLVNAMPGLLRMGDIFSRYKKVNSGDLVYFDLSANNTVSLNIMGKIETIPGGEEFFKAIMMVWLGANPVDWKLKDAMLAGGVQAKGNAASGTKK